jgi:hypothetical protein
MSVRSRFAAVGIVLFLVGALAVSRWVTAGDRVQLSIHTADGAVGAEVASFQVGDVTYGFRHSVAWTDAEGSFHDSGWPACLTAGDAKNVRIGVSTLWVEDRFGWSAVLWVDCRGR